VLVTGNFLVTWTVVQGVYSRTNKFDGSNYHISTVENVAKLVKSPSTGLWLNVQVTMNWNVIDYFVL
jgi:hypothetical protein